MPQPSDTPTKKPARTRERKPRGRGLRTRTGCITCRKRHLKCNEVKPVCGPCTRSNHTCVYGDPSTSTSEPTSGSTSKSISVTTSASHSAPASIAAPADPDFPRNDSAGQADLVFRTQWSHGDPLNGSPSQFLARSTSWPVQKGHASAPQSVIEFENDKHTSLATHWTPAFDELESLGLNKRPPSIQSEIISPYVPAPLSVNIARSYTGSEDYPVSSQVPNIGPYRDAAIAKWFGLLASDADLQHGANTSDFDWNQRASNGEQAQNNVMKGTPEEQEWQDNFVSATMSGNANTTTTTTAPESSQPCLPSPHLFKNQNGRGDPPPWQSREPLILQTHELEIFDNFVTRISHWIDLFDPMQNFSTYVPHLAMHNVGLLNAILALSARHMSPTTKHASKKSHNRNDALQYYHETLRYIQNAMQHDSYNSSDELRATCLVISAYEMIDGSHRDWERHLQGFHRLQRSQIIHGDSKGLKQAVWWAWLCQDIWAAFREKRKPFTSWRPNRGYSDMTSYELAARSAYLMARVVSYCSQEAIDHGEHDAKGRMAKGELLINMLNEWKQHLPIEFNPLPMPSRPNNVFQPIWIHPPAFSVAIQLYCAAMILLLRHNPGLKAFGDLAQRQAAIASHTETICGLSSTLTDDASSVMSSQCLFIAGLCVQDQQERMEIVRLLKACRERAGWPVNTLSDDLQMIWNGLSESPLP